MMRCTPGFKKLLAQIKDILKEDLHTLWSEADIVHDTVLKKGKELGIKNLPDKL